MKKRIMIIAILMLTISFLPIAKAQEDGSGSYTESFDKSLTEWETSDGVKVENGVLKISPQNFAAKFGEVENPTISLKLKYQQNSIARMLYHMSESGYYSLNVGGGLITLDKDEKGTPTQLGTASLSNIQSDSWITLAVSFNGTTHKITVNGLELFSANDSSPLPKGGFSINVEGENALEFDDLSIKGSFTKEPQMGTGNEEEMPEANQEAIAIKTTMPKIQGSGDAAAIGTVEEEGLKSYIAQFFYDKRADTTMSTFVINLLLATVFAYVLGKAYIYWGSSLSNRRRFAANFMLMTITTTFIIMVVRSSVALSLGLVGALSIVRFRTAVKEPEELAYLFMAIGIGIGLGDNQRLLTLIALTVTIVIIGLVRTFKKPHRDTNLHLTVASHGNHKIGLEQMVDVLKDHCTKYKLLRSDDTRDLMEASFMIEFNKFDDMHTAQDELKKLSPAIEITFLDNQGIW